MITGRAIADAEGVLASGGKGAAVLVRLHALVEGSPNRVRCEMLAAGPFDEVRRHPQARGVETLERPTAVILPGLVNAHTHLDLTHIGPQPYDRSRGFVGWIDDLRAKRATDRAAVMASCEEGVARSLEGGTVVVGDIAGAAMGRACTWPIEALIESPLSGVAFVEFFAAGAREEAGLVALGTAGPEIARLAAECEALRIGIQPHAPYSVSLVAYVAAVKGSGRARFATHVGESPEERMLIATGDGPLREFLESAGVWNERCGREFETRRALARAQAGGAGLGPRGLSPVRYLEVALESGPFLAVHVNDCEDGDIEILKRTRTSVAYCPRASAYFGAEEHFGPHRYRDMLAAGVNVALGTDSIVGLRPEASTAAGSGTGGARISVLDEMRYLWRRDQTAPGTLLAMATTNGAKALGLRPVGLTFRGPVGTNLAGVMVVEIPKGVPDDRVLEGVLDAQTPPELILFGVV